MHVIVAHVHPSMSSCILHQNDATCLFSFTWIDSYVGLKVGETECLCALTKLYLYMCVFMHLQTLITRTLLRSQIHTESLHKALLQSLHLGLNKCISDMIFQKTGNPFLCTGLGQWDGGVKCRKKRGEKMTYWRRGRILLGGIMETD